MKALIPALVLFSAPAFAQTLPKIDFSKFPTESVLIEEVVVPIPGEVFRVLDKLGKPKWTAIENRYEGVVQPFGDQSNIALVLGVVIADGFVAVEAEDSEEVQQIGKSVLNLAKAVGVEKAVIKRSKSIVDFAADKAWDAVRRELDGALKDVKTAMAEVNSQSLSQLVSLGGWLRGTEALSEVVSTDFSADGAELLDQPLLVDHFERQLANFSPKRKASPVVAKLQKGLKELRPLVHPAEGAEIDEKSVTEVHALTSALTKAIRKKAP